jgi:hypothetical protein
LLTPAQVIPFLSHPDPWVRRQALDYLVPAHDPSPATADDLWRAMDAVPPTERHAFLSSLSDLPQTQYSAGRLIAALRNVAYDDHEEDLIDALRSLDFDLIPKFLEEIRATDGSEDIVPHLEARLELATKPPEQLWQSLIENSNDAEDDDESDEEEEEDEYDYGWDDVDEELAERLIEALARHPEFAGPRVLEILSGRHRETWLETWCATLAGRMRLSAAVEPLLALLAQDTYADALGEEILRALVRLGSPEGVARIENFMTGAESGPRITAIDALGGIKLPQSERLLRDLIPTEEDPTVVTFLASSLTDLCPTDPQTLELLRSVAVEEKYNPYEINIPEQLAAVATMVGWEFPELAKWRKNAAEDDREERELLENPAAFDIFAKKLAQRQFEREQPAQIPPPEPLTPYRREAPKVGRNDPCPCGSGKKYKKCCG